MAYMTLIAECCSCHKMFSCNPDLVPSIRIDAVRQPLCEGCFDKWNQIHRVGKGLEAIELNSRAYSAEEC